ncbi:demethylmenaquinone methyltransferase [Halobacillus andaensis]|uniref:Demethylmenaquinone methyltransferase n=1 Tax=Halobacillus andaensis TaxID=1176239 RepID=A0A917ET31_HALAA|nr:demethylmenaquinone methyltransferase [Halobacillus andaensis]MBP2003266.1 demethylmenaquinone methyltransferase/2-methoxy-6-polyprenyl-1,4-benzoquinol methylase [Halobacillus andaensis]GGF09375.1 demethylmenaquinone methyltransferase [Halobacillus andaensis]
MQHPQSKEERVHHVFEKIYNRYDAMNSIISFQQHRLWRNDVMKRMNVKEGDCTLDVCCGTGDWTMSLANQVGPTGKVIGLDFSVNMLSVAIKKKLSTRLKHVEFEHGNAMSLPFNDNQFDFVTIGFGLRNVPDYQQVLNEMYRVVKPGGKVVCLETSQPTNPVFKRLYYFYFGYVMPLFGKLFARSYKEYSWLHESAKDFPGKNELAEMFNQAGLIHIQVKSFTGGVAAMHMGEKPS